MFRSGRITDLETAARAISDGHVDMVALTRGHMADPYIVRKLIDGRSDDIRPVGKNYCTDGIYMRRLRCFALGVHGGPIWTARDITGLRFAHVGKTHALEHERVTVIFKWVNFAPVGKRQDPGPNRAPRSARRTTSNVN